MKRTGRKRMIYLAALLIVFIIALIALDRSIARIGSRRIVEPFEAPQVDAIIVPGAKINPPGVPSTMLKDRLDTALGLYVEKKSDRILVSGDGRESSLNETAVMARYLMDAGVPEAHILIDPEGFDTFQTIVRAKNVFGIETSIMTTQTFHLERAMYIATSLDIDMLGVASDVRSYAVMWYMRLREMPARVKALIEVHRAR